MYAYAYIAVHARLYVCTCIAAQGILAPHRFIEKWSVWLQVLAMVTTEFQRTADLCVEVPKSLPVLFGMFMGRNKTMGVKQHSDDARQQLETVVSIIANLMHYCKKCVPFSC